MLIASCSRDSGNLEQANAVPQARECTATGPLVGQSSTLTESSTYGIRGLVTIVSDCEIEISNFFYNGSGPNVSVYAGVNGNFTNGVNMSAPLNGTRFQGETLHFFLPEGASFNDFNSISIWCFQFDINFSSASF